MHRGGNKKKGHLCGQRHLEPRVDIIWPILLQMPQRKYDLPQVIQPNKSGSGSSAWAPWVPSLGPLYSLGSKWRFSRNSGLEADEGNPEKLSLPCSLSHYREEFRSLWTRPFVLSLLHPNATHIHTHTHTQMCAHSLCFNVTRAFLYWGNTPQKCDIHLILKNPQNRLIQICEELKYSN